MTAEKDDQLAAIGRDVLRAFDDLNGLHPGFRPAHAKGILVSRVFTPSSAARLFSIRFRASTVLIRL
jgi:catalase